MSDSYRGKILIAGKDLRDPNFFKSVVLMVEHGAEGAMGLVVNRPSSITVENALSGHFDCQLPDDHVYFGGPVEPSALFIMHTAEELNDSETSVIPGVYVGNSAAAFERVVEAAAQGLDELEFRIFFGCAGWAPGQLEGEIARGDWFVHPATRDLVFFHDAYDIWDRAVKQVYEAHRILPFMPDNPEWN